MNRQQFEAKGSVRFGVRSGSVRLLVWYGVLLVFRFGFWLDSGFDSVRGLVLCVVRFGSVRGSVWFGFCFGLLRAQNGSRLCLVFDQFRDSV